MSAAHAKKAGKDYHLLATTEKDVDEESALVDESLESATPHAAQQKSSWRWFGLCVALLFLGALGLSYWHYNAPEAISLPESTDDFVSPWVKPDATEGDASTDLDHINADSTQHGEPNSTLVNTQPTVITQHGQLLGVHSPEYDQDFFLGIAYAKPPVGDLRFRAPLPLDINPNATIDATSYGAHCIHYGRSYGLTNFSEDCLYLNVIRPHGISADTKLPVGIWIHGGAFVEGGASTPRYNLSFLVENGQRLGTPIIGVSINYRLSAWGFLPGDEANAEKVNNIALRDQRAAMQYIKDNVAAFGGDPDKVTLFGESAGAVSIGLQLAAFGGRDDRLFHQAIMQSGSLHYKALKTKEQGNSLFGLLVKSAGCQESSEHIQCLRELDFDSLNKAIRGALSTNYGPGLDDDIIQGSTAQQFVDGAFVHVPVMVGANTDEGTSFTPRTINSTASFEHMLAASRGGHTAELLKAYPDDDCFGSPIALNCTRPAPPYGLQYRRAASYVGDKAFIANRRYTCETWAKNNITAYCYRFNVRPSGSTEMDGVGHALDLGFTFDNVEGVGYRQMGVTSPFEGKGDDYAAVAHRMSKTLVSFIATGDPNAWLQGQDVRDENDVKVWPKYDLDDPVLFVWDLSGPMLEADTWRKEGIHIIMQDAIVDGR